MQSWKKRGRVVAAVVVDFLGAYDLPHDGFEQRACFVVVSGTELGLCQHKSKTMAKVMGGNTATLPISVFLLTVLLGGFWRSLIYIGQLDFFITQSPKGMKTMSTDLFLSTLSLGFFVSSFLVSVVKRVTGSKDGQGGLANNINYRRLDCFYGLLAILSFINFIVFLICAVWYKPQKPNDGMQMETMANGSCPEEKC
ncbi:protein NRT1/ PTR FAMILY 6.2-like [Vitis riparia]|uniref:protein NRT1/ PTR FAMILY 6.2-like n=1 Tax=Vitis riparia TaxID=96939 RepID=UPI00155AF67A|nr:protein NRT1/ PTR FAMILY 6.2-like [Vitis riparia]